MPDSSGNVTIIPASLELTNALSRADIAVFADTATRDELHGRFTVPSDYVDTANVLIIWTANAIVNDWEADFDYRAIGGDDLESLDPAAWQESVNLNDTAPSAVFERMELRITLTDGNFAPGDTVPYVLARDGTDGGDTMAAKVLVFEMYFEYNDA